MIKIIKNIDVYTPTHLGKKDILIADDRFAAIEDEIVSPIGFPALEVIDGKGQLAVPGFIDSHVHITGGGGEGSFKTRTPELKLIDATLAGVTTVIGTRGTDGMARSMETLVAKAKALKEEGISCWIYTGAYQVPVQTITDRIESDIMMIDEIIGVGEVALSDHRSSQPTFDEIAKIAAAARVGGMLSGKAGVVNIHVGDGKRGLSLIKEIIRKTELPYKQFIPTHINRNSDLLEEGMVYARDGGFIDFTTSTAPQFSDEGETKCSRALKICLERDVPVGQITFTSDSQGSLPLFDEQGQLIRLVVANSASLFCEVRDAVQDEGLPLEIALKVITENPAKICKLAHKGHIREGFDADMVLLNPDDLSIRTVFAMGRMMVEDGRAVVKGTFD
jgi:beta-aspartyl-dipeptidase (metallo-type)